MAITSITIENFKCIGDAVTIPIRPITLLFGKNSSGKSTVLQALRYWLAIRDRIKRDIEQEGELNTIKMSGGYTIDLENFPSLVHRHELDRKIRIRIAYDRNTVDKQGKNSLIWSEIVTSEKESSTKIESVLSAHVVDGKEVCFATGELPDDVVVGSNGKELISKKIDNFYLGSALAFDLLAPSLLTGGIGGGLAGLAGRLLGAGLASFIINLIKKKIMSRKLQEPKRFDDIRHLGPFRELPSRHYDEPQTVDEGQDKLQRWEKGLGAWDTLARDSKVLEKTNHYMRHVLKLGYSINHREQNSTDREQWPRLHDENNGIDVRPSDVGVGIAQVIPVVVGTLDCVQSPEIFAVEQPELHLHPATQVALGDVFIDSIKNSNRNHTMLVETHSEHLLLRLLRRVHETSSTRVDTKYKLPPNDLSVVYVQSTLAGAKFTPVSVTDDGDFDEPWPEGFFDERDSELFYHA